MLIRLTVRNFVIVELLELEFGSGLTALTGETGAGKSILVDALALAMGERADAGCIRMGADRADITAEFSVEGDSPLGPWLAEHELKGDPGVVVLRRIVEGGGRSRGLINGHTATLAQLRQVGEWLVDIHGQHAHQSLLRPETQRDILDSQGGLSPLADEVAQAYRAWRRLAQAKAEHEKNLQILNVEREQLAWRVEELTRISPVEGEWETVHSEQTRLAHAASLIEGAGSAVDALSESDASSLSSLAAVTGRLRGLAAYDARLNDIVALLDGAEAQIHEAVSELRQYADRVDLDPARLRDMEARVDALHGAARRLRVRPEELPATLAAAQLRLAELDRAVDLEALAKQEQTALAQYQERARALTTARKKAARSLVKEITGSLGELAMSGARFDINLRAVPDGSPGGDEQVEFLVAANAGGNPQPLAKVASGGELSRISLAVQVVASKSKAVGTLIFDEVDSGIGGGVAEIVGQKLRKLGERGQVLCVTHLGQVAAQADSQWSVRKVAAGESVRSVVEVLEGKARVEEIARMIGGLEITAATRKHAIELLRTR